MSELYGFKKNLEKVQVRSKSESAAKSHLVPTLISSTPLAAPATRYEYATRTIPELANWNVVVLYCKCGNTQQNIICFRNAVTGNYLIDALTSTVTRGVYYVDWANNRIMVRWVDGNASLAQSFVQILAVYGLVQNVDVVDTDTEDEGGDEGEDIDITGLTEEVLGIRIGADGTIYETAGEAVREQYNKLAEMLDVLNVEDAMETIQNAVDTAIEQIETAGGLILDPTLTQSGQAADAKVVGDTFKNVMLSLSERINSDNYASSGITDIISMPTNRYVVFYTYPENIKRITQQMVANLPSYDHAYICVLKMSPSNNPFASYMAWGFTSAAGVEAIYVANGKGSTSNTPWVKIWDKDNNVDTILQMLDNTGSSSVHMSASERIGKNNLSTYGITDVVSMPTNRYIAFLTNPSSSNAVTAEDVSNLPAYTHNFICILKMSPSNNSYASYMAWGFSSANGVEAIYVANGTGSTANTPWVKIWDKNKNIDNIFKIDKKVSIIGDSISTFSGYLPDGYSAYYPKSGADVNSVEDTWWKKVLNKTGMTLLKNASWASSAVAGDDTQGAIVASSDSRIDDLADGSTTPDIIIVLMGTNDFARSYQIGTFTDTDTIPTASNVADFKPAYAKMLYKIQQAYPDAKVFVCTLIPRTFSGGGYPAKDQNNESLYAFNKAIKDVAEMMNCSIIDINMDSGINMQNLSEHFIRETSGSYIHPLASGHAMIAECVARNLITKYII